MCDEVDGANIFLPFPVPPQILNLPTSGWFQIFGYTWLGAKPFLQLLTTHPLRPHSPPAPDPNCRTVVTSANGRLTLAVYTSRQVRFRGDAWFGGYRALTKSSFTRFLMVFTHFFKGNFNHFYNVFFRVPCQENERTVCFLYLIIPKM